MSLIADIVVSSAAAAFAHFGVTLDLPEREPVQPERTVARTPVPKAEPAAAAAPAANEDCPERKALIRRV